MPLRLCLMAALVLCLSACSTTPEWVPPPVQYTFSPDAEPRLVGVLAAMDDPLVESYIISGVLKGDRGSPWRWANEKVELRFQLGDFKPTRFIVDFVIAESTFEITGPVKLSLKLADKPVATLAVNEHGQQSWSVPVDYSQFDPVTPIVATIEVDKFYTAENDGTKLAMLLQRAGFLQ